MKKIGTALLMMALLLFGIFFNRERPSGTYDEGYDAGWNDEGKPSRSASEAMKRGYEDGQADAFNYDDGYCDGFNERRPTFKEEFMYMDGYRKGKEDRKRF